jgi:hypothetical protein
VEVHDGAPQGAEAVRLMMQQAVAGVPDGVAVSTVSLADPYDPVALWMRTFGRPLFDR